MMGKWNNQEMEYLKDNYPVKTNKELSISLNKSVQQIMNKRQRLKLKKDEETLKRCYIGVSSERMKLNNPMKNKENLKKMRNTKIIQGKKGLIVGMLGKNHTIESKEKMSINLENKRDFIIEKYNSGLTLRQVGLLLGVSANTIKRRMIKWRIPRRTECKYSTFHTTNDGHVVKSSMELECDNILSF